MQAAFYDCKQAACISSVGPALYSNILVAFLPQRIHVSFVSFDCKDYYVYTNLFSFFAYLLIYLLDNS